MSSPALKPFALLTPRLVILPTPFAVKVKAYRSLYSRLHSLPEFCTMAFGDQFEVRTRDDEEMIPWITSEVDRNWNVKGLGDCAVGVWNGDPQLGIPISSEDYVDGSNVLDVRLVSGSDFETLESGLKEVTWVGYVGVRDATPRLPPRESHDPELPPWEEMVEIRYGYSPDAWGKGYGTEAARSLMLWSAKVKGVRRFIAETERHNSGSGKILSKLGFERRMGNEYWKDVGEFEWERKAARG